MINKELYRSKVFTCKTLELLLTKEYYGHKLDAIQSKNKSAT